MPTDGSGVYTLPSGYLATLGQVIQPSQHNPPLEDVATALTNRLTRNGSGSMTGNFNGGGFRLTNIAAASSGTDAVQQNQGDARYLRLAAPETSIAAAATVDLSTSTNYSVVITGGSTISSFGTGANLIRHVRFTGTGGIIHNATTLIAPTGVDFLYQPGDAMMCRSDGSGNWRILEYFRATSGALADSWLGTSAAATINLAANNRRNVLITGATAITSFGTGADGLVVTIRAGSTLTLTHSANLVCPDGVNLVLQTDDFARVTCVGGGVWHVTDVRVLATTTAPGLMSAGDKVKVDAAPAFISVASVSTASGTAFDFTGLPSDTVKISLNFSGVSLSGTDNMLVQLGDSGGFETTGYSGAGTGTTGSGGGTVANSSGFIVRVAIAAELMSGTMTFEKVSGTNEWIASHSLGGVGTSAFGGGAKTLSDVLTQVRLTRTGTNTFDAGSVSLTYVRAS